MLFVVAFKPDWSLNCLERVRVARIFSKMCWELLKKKIRCSPLLSGNLLMKSHLRPITQEACKRPLEARPAAKESSLENPPSERFLRSCLTTKASLVYHQPR